MSAFKNQSGFECSTIKKHDSKISISYQILLSYGSVFSRNLLIWTVNLKNMGIFFEGLPYKVLIENKIYQGYSNQVGTFQNKSLESLFLPVTKTFKNVF